MEVIASHALIVGRAGTGKTALVTGQTVAIVEVITWLAGGTIVGVGAAASVAFGLARGTDHVGVLIRELDDQLVAVLAFAVGVASSGTIALAVAVAFSDDALVEDVIVINAFGGQAFAELQEETGVTFGTIVVVGAVASQAGLIAWGPVA